ncbi:unnamed protein product, partial [Scytosiphon promiscuus]
RGLGEAGQQPVQVRACALGKVGGARTEKLEDGCFEDLWGVAEGQDEGGGGDDPWRVSSGRGALAGLGVGGSAEEDTSTMLMHSEAEVEEAGGSAQFGDLAA